MIPARLKQLALLLALTALGAWLITRPTSPAPETIAHHQAIQALAPGGNAGSGGPVGAEAADPGSFVYGDPVSPAEVDMMALPSGPAEVDELYQRYLNGEIDFEANEGPYSDAIFQAMIAESMKQGVDRTVQNYAPNGVESTLTVGASFKSIDYTQSQQGVPPDPDIMVGTNHVVVGVNTSFQVFDKNGTSLVGPTLYDTFWGANCGTGAATMSFFDPFSDFDESANRYVMGITAYDTAVNGGDNGYACIAVSKTDSATGQWWLYSFDGNPGTGTDYFFDYPHLGVGQSALYLSANMFGASYVRSHIFAYDKAAMYAGTTANSVKFNSTSADFTFQPAKIHGFDDGGWPTNASEPHYFITANYGNNQTVLKVWRLSNPWSSPTFAQAGSVTVNSYSMPVNQPQSGSTGLMQGNDNRLLDVQYRAGRLWATHAIGCNPGGGTVNCVRWYEINISSGTPSLIQQGTFSSASNYRSFPDLAVNRCGDMVVGYTRMSSTTFPSVYVAGRETADATGQLKNETLVHAGEAFYTAYDASPRRWGDYTGMAIDPDGLRFWYVGEYSRNQATARWSTWVSSSTFPGCTGGGPTPTPPPGPTPTHTPTPTSTPIPPSCPNLSGTYCRTDNESRSWIAGTTNQAITGDDQTKSVTLPFTFNFMATNYTSVIISANGNVHFGTANGAYTNTSLPNTGAPNALIAAMWDDLNPAAGGTIWTTTSGTAPNRTFVIEWRDVRAYNSGTNGATFQIQLVETSNHIWIVYQDSTFGAAASDNGASATSGIENSGGTAGNQYSFNSAVLTSGKVLHFWKP